MSAPAAPSSPHTSQPPSPQPRPSAGDDSNHFRRDRDLDRDGDSDSFSTGRRTPVPAFDSSAALILVSSHENDDDDDHEDASGHDDDLDARADEEHGPLETTFDFSSDDDRHDDLEDDAERENEDRDSEDAALLFSRRAPPGAHTRFRSASFDLSPGPSASAGPPLSSLTVFVYLLAPLLKLGALLALAPPALNDLSLRAALIALVFFAGLCALARQVWYMLARYVRRADMEEVLIQTFARGIGRGRNGEREKRRLYVRRAVRVCTGVVRLLLVAVYLRGAFSPVMFVIARPRIVLEADRILFIFSIDASLYANIHETRPRRINALTPHTRLSRPYQRQQHPWMPFPLSSHRQTHWSSGSPQHLCLPSLPHRSPSVPLLHHPQHFMPHGPLLLRT